MGGKPDGKHQSGRKAPPAVRGRPRPPKPTAKRALAEAIHAGLVAELRQAIRERNIDPGGYGVSWTHVE